MNYGKTEDISEMKQVIENWTFKEMTMANGVMFHHKKRDVILVVYRRVVRVFKNRKDGFHGGEFKWPVHYSIKLEKKTPKGLYQRLAYFV